MSALLLCVLAKTMVTFSALFCFFFLGGGRGLEERGLEGVSWLCSVAGFISGVGRLAFCAAENSSLLPCESPT